VIRKAMEMQMGTIVNKFVAHLYKSTKNKLVLHVTGAGASSISWLLSVPGASQTVLEATVPYSKISADYMVYPDRIDRYVSPEAAILLAKKAYHRALELQAHTVTNERFIHEYVENIVKHTVGISCTGALSTNRERKGDDKAHIGIYSHSGYKTYDLVLDKRIRDREGEELLVGSIILNSIGNACFTSASDFNAEIVLELREWIKNSLTKHENIVHYINDTITNNQVLKKRFFNGDDLLGIYIPSLNKELSQEDATGLFQPSIVLKDDIPIVRIVYPGSFNPLHIGHVKLAQVAKKILHERNPGSRFITIFELSVQNADKDMLDEMTVVQRLAQFNRDENNNGCDPTIRKELYKEEMNYDNLVIALTRAPLFIQKAQIMPGSVFVIGMDTAIRLIDPKYYNNSLEEMVNALVKFKLLNCKFMVAGRQKQKDPNDKSFQTLKDIDMEKLQGLRDLFIEIPESEFRVDISSTELRKKNSANL
jgi:nicotinic acid mononucleotide adenylyltransferase/nicotinamide mononucleotide (NMN) deamidase PncC